MEKIFHVYIMTNRSQTLYIGVTSNLVKRVFEHKGKFISGFTQKYKIDKLVYYEQYEDALTAIAREKELKKWIRRKKMALVEAKNPEWKELEI